MRSGASTRRFRVDLPRRERIGRMWHAVLLAATAVGIIALAALFAGILDDSFGYVALEARVDPDTLTVGGVPIEQQGREQLIAHLRAALSPGAINKLEVERPFADRSRAELYAIVVERIVRLKVVESWSLWASMTDVDGIRAHSAELYPQAELRFRSWLNPAFVTRPQTSEALTSGVRTAILGTLWTILFTVLLAFPMGVGAAIYLEEYAGSSWLNRLIRTNINNLAGVPSIVYGILGLAIFVRALQPFTSGAALGLADAGAATGRTVLSAGLTLGLVVLPIIIINAQEAIRAVPGSLRNASYGLGATKWQTIAHHVLPNALPGILTGTILAVSRAIGETAPLVVVGAATAISFDPSSPFSRFTTLPVQIYQWTSRPQAEFRSLAAAAILVLLVLLLSLNAGAILLRRRSARSL